MILLGLLFALFFGQADLDIPTPDLPEMQASCDAQGGLFFQQRSGAWQCLVPLADEGQSCSTANDCAGYCIGGDVPERSTCSRYPIGPGCTTFLNDTGEEVTICVD
jgi:hypothetical protein